MNDDDRREIAIFRVGVLGPLVGARLEHGERKELFEEAAKRDWMEPPDDRVVRYSPRTIQDWYYAHRRHGLEGLMPAPRADEGRSRAISSGVCDLILRAKLEKPRRSIRRIIKILERAGKVKPGDLSRSSVHRFLQSAGVSRRPRREDVTPDGSVKERRSFIAEHVGDLCVGDALHVHREVIVPGIGIAKTYMLSQIDSASRFVPHSYFAPNEQAADQEHGLLQAILKYGVPRAYYVDHGPAYVAGSLRGICADLSCRLMHAGKGDAPAKGVIERWHRTWREEVEDELPPGPIKLEDLSAIHFAWLAREYHVRLHETVGMPPRDRFLAEVGELEPAPRRPKLDNIFLHRIKRVVRKDGTVRWGGKYLEVRPELEGQTVEIRFHPRDPNVRPRVFIGGEPYCDTVPLDRLANLHRTRRHMTRAADPAVEPTGLDPLGDLVAEHARTSRLGHLATDDDDEGDDTDDGIINGDDTTKEG